MLQVDHLAKTYGDGKSAVEAIGDLSFEVGEGEFLCVVGPSGCGKTTLLKCMSGLLAPSGGEVRLHDQPVDGPPETMALVFQEYSRSLFPWMSVRQNVAFPLKRKRLPKAELGTRVERAVESVDLTGFLDRYPWELSGGMQQRVALVRALIHDPALLLMDEPFGALDALTREAMNVELQRIWMESRKTVVFITHSTSEAVFLGDRVMVMTPRPGKVEDMLEIDLPRPRSLDVMTTEKFGTYVRRIRKSLNAGGGLE
jgi:NitT/TauT family transport system ATP-binding protein